MYLYANPDDGWAYTPIELTAIWAIEVDPDLIAQGRLNIFAFHEHQAIQGSVPDHLAGEILLRDSIAQLTDPAPADLLSECPHACRYPWLGYWTSGTTGISYTRCCAKAFRPRPNNDQEDDGA